MKYNYHDNSESNEMKHLKIKANRSAIFTSLMGVLYFLININSIAIKNVICLVTALSFGIWIKNIIGIYRLANENEK